ncbi:S1 RNA-binding domain-containing protein, partial [Candidatus Shapirobacteria bacterium]|nr:S1 RNA-binding domain-containing protein [Candidatus Shapirobacteria bacterium]
MAGKQKPSPELPKGEPQTMGALLARAPSSIRGWKKGEVLTGKITAIFPKSLFVDIGGKTDGVILGRELEAVKDYAKTLKVGDKVEVVVGEPETESGQVLINLRKSAQNYAWNFYNEKLKNGAEVEVQGRELNRGGLIVDAPHHLQGFIPSSQIGTMWQGKLEALINRPLKAKVIEVSRSENRLVFSEKQVSQAKEISAQKAALKKIRLQETYGGTIIQVLPYGLLVSCQIPGAEQGVEGLVHISEIAWEKVEDINQLYKAGEKVKVLALEVNEGRLQLSLKRLLPDPWEKVEKKYPADTHFKGKVTKLTPYGALVEIEPGIEGLLHISKIPPTEKIDVGTEISCFVETVDRPNRRISLGLVLKA